MKKIYNFQLVLGFLLAMSFISSAQINAPRASQQASVSQTIGISTVTINYSRPAVKGREIWGSLVPYGMNNLGFGTSKAAPWRAGADENTTIELSHDAEVEGKPIKSGIYGLHFEVREDNTATLILSHDYQSWGSFFYDASEDALRADIKTEQAPHHELLTFQFDEVSPSSATASLIWAEKAFPFEVSFDVTEIVLDEFREASKGQTGFQRQNWEQAANYAVNNGGDLEEALGWIDNAISGQFYSQKTFNNLAIKGQILKKMGRDDEYTALMNEAMGMANTNQLNTLGYQMLGSKDYDMALKCFKKAVKLSPENPNVYDSLGEGYYTMGNKEEAIKNFKKSLSMNPPANVRANSEKYLRQMGEL